MNKLKPHAKIMHKKYFESRQNEIILFMLLTKVVNHEEKQGAGHHIHQNCVAHGSQVVDVMGRDSRRTAKGKNTVFFLDQAGNYTIFSFIIIF